MSSNMKTTQISESIGHQLNSKLEQNIDNKVIITIGSRKSNLALIQTKYILNKLIENYGNRYHFQIKSMTTTGDNILNIPLSKIGEKALFTRELEEELIDRKIDFIVHSLKDLPTSLPNGCSIGCITEREDPSDALVLKSGLELENAFDILRSKSATIGTSSLRRIAQLKHLNPDIKVADIRGNLNTRLSKLDQQNSYSALILASAGLKRADFSNRISKRLLIDWYYAVGQGAIAVETRSDDTFIIDLLKPLIDMKTTLECLAERTFMQTLEGGCSVPIGVKTSWNELSDNRSLLTLDGIVLSLDGRRTVTNKMEIDLNETLIVSKAVNSCPFDYTGIAINQITDEIYINKLRNSALLGFELAQSLLDSGAKQLLDTIK